MRTAVPAWFKCNQIFGVGEAWFVGEPDSLHFGPYRDQHTAETKSEVFMQRLREIKDHDARLNLVRQLLEEEWQTIDDGTDIGFEEIEVQAVDYDPVRHGEAIQSWSRSQRYFQVDGVWFFATREGLDVGPFDSEQEARESEKRLKTLLIKCRSAEEAHRCILEYKHKPRRHKLDAIKFEGLRQFRSKG